jgi:hypothetical protein
LGNLKSVAQIYEGFASASKHLYFSPGLANAELLDLEGQSFVNPKFINQ